MYRSLLATLLTLGLASAAGAASLALSSDKQSYNIGETIVITLTAVIESGDVAPPNSNVIIKHDLTQVVGLGAPSGTGSNSGPTLTQFGGQSKATVNGNQGKCNWALGRDDQCLAIAQIHVSGEELDPGIYEFVLEYSVDHIGPYFFNFQDEAPNDLVFAGYDDGDATGNAPPGLILNVFVPEPATALLLGLGLLGVAMGSRRRQ